MPIDPNRLQEMLDTGIALIKDDFTALAGIARQIAEEAGGGLPETAEVLACLSAGVVATRALDAVESMCEGAKERPDWADCFLHQFLESAYDAAAPPSGPVRDRAELHRRAKRANLIIPPG